MYEYIVESVLSGEIREDGREKRKSTRGYNRKCANSEHSSWNLVSLVRALILFRPNK
jgi:hypothetical protein